MVLFSFTNKIMEQQLDYTCHSFKKFGARSECNWDIHMEQFWL